MYISLEKNDLNKISKKFSYENLQEIKRIKIKGYLWSIMLSIMITSLILIIKKLLGINFNGTKEIKSLFFINLGFLLSSLFLWIKYLENKELKKYNYLINNFFVNINKEKKIIEFFLREMKISIEIKKENIELLDDTLLFYNEKKISVLIPLEKLKKNKEFLDEIKNCIGENNYGI